MSCSRGNIHKTELNDEHKGELVRCGLHVSLLVTGSSVETSGANKGAGGCGLVCLFALA